MYAKVTEHAIEKVNLKEKKRLLTKKQQKSKLKMQKSVIFVKKDLKINI